MPNSRRKSIVNWREIGMYKTFGMNSNVLVPIACILISAALAWGAWNTKVTFNAVSRVTFNTHVQAYAAHIKDNGDQYLRMIEIVKAQGERIEDKLDVIQRDVRNNGSVVRSYPVRKNIDKEGD